MSNKPIVTWYNATHSAEVAAPYDFNTIDADTKGPIHIFNIWNNRYVVNKGTGVEDVAKMEDCTITTRDMGNGTGDTPQYNIEVVKNNWFHAQVDSLSETDIDQDTSKIGKIASKPIGTTGKTTKKSDGSLYDTPRVPGAKEILGVSNNGTPTDAAGNYVTVSLRCAVPFDASSGKQAFKLRVSYRYV
ncbi:hypothetical protein [Paenibacillus taichungensis]|uniref:hypothetical protein n=1 Tax=Paenibacillus taichungensis TaxID=484184 RepID=UPI0039A301F6